LSSFVSTLVREQTAPLRHGCVADAMVNEPTVHDASVRVRELRHVFRDDHFHIALLVDADHLIAAVERDDLSASIPGTMPARAVGLLRGRTIGPDASLSEAISAMRLAARRRLAVVDRSGALLGLLCLKASGDGFCSDRTVRERREERAAREQEHATPALRRAS
jgi:predicted transcriptional regulator